MPPHTTGVTLSIVVEAPAGAAGFSASAPVEITLVLRNPGPHPLWLNRRFALDSPQAPRFSRELWIDFRGPDGRNVELRTEGRVARFAPVAADEHYGLLAPGAEERVVIDLRARFLLPGPGRYLLRAHYADGNEHPAPAPAGAIPLRDHLQSPRLELRIEGA